MRVLQLALAPLLFTSCLLFSDEPEFLKVEITDPAQLPPAERKERALSTLEVLERWPAGDAAKAFVGPLLMFHREFAGELAERAARALARVTGQDFGTDFAAWEGWYRTVRDDVAWKPSPMFRIVRSPKHVLEGPAAIIVYSPSAPEEMKDGWKRLMAPCAIRSIRLGLYARAEDDLEMRADPKTFRLSLRSATAFGVSILGGTSPSIARVKEIDIDALPLYGLEFLDLEALRKAL